MLISVNGIANGDEIPDAKQHGERERNAGKNTETIKTLFPDT